MSTDNPTPTPLASTAMEAAKKPLFYSYDPEDGIRFHATPEEAMARAEKALDDANFHAADSDWSWNENEDEISWGDVRGKVTVTDRPLDEEEKSENPEWEFIRSLSLEDYPGSLQPLLAKVEGERDAANERIRMIERDAKKQDDERYHLERAERMSADAIAGLDEKMAKILGVIDLPKALRELREYNKEVSAKLKSPTEVEKLRADLAAKEAALEKLTGSRDHYFNLAKAQLVRAELAERALASRADKGGAR